MKETVLQILDNDKNLWSSTQPLLTGTRYNMINKTVNFFTPQERSWNVLSEDMGVRLLLYLYDATRLTITM